MEHTLEQIMNVIVKVVVRSGADSPERAREMIEKNLNNLGLLNQIDTGHINHAVFMVGLTGGLFTAHR